MSLARLTVLRNDSGEQAFGPKEISPGTKQGRLQVEETSSIEWIS
jgi:hypothetical protein